MKLKSSLVPMFIVGFCTGASLLTISSLTYNKENTVWSSIPKRRQQPITSSETPKRQASSFEFTNLVESLQHERRNTIINACKAWDKKFNGRMKRPNMDALYSRKYRLAVCDVPRCASSSWLRFVSGDGLPENDVTRDDVVLLRRNSSRFGAEFRRGGKAVAAWNKRTFRVVTVRNPFHRLVSAYRDRLLLAGKKFNRKVSLRINRDFRHMRQSAAERNATADSPASFEDFVHFLLYSKFKEAAWRSFNVTCQPCAVTYDYVMKFDTLKEDAKYLRSRLNLTRSDAGAFFPESEFRTDDESVYEHFRTLPKSLSLELYKHYKMDFDLFGYPRPKWL